MKTLSLSTLQESTVALSADEVERGREDFDLPVDTRDVVVRWHIEMERMYGDGWPADRWDFLKRR